MALRIERKKDNRAGKCILHRIADIPGGVTVSTANLSGVVLKEGTPIGKGENGMYSVCKTAVLQEANSTKLTVKGVHHFKVGGNRGKQDDESGSGGCRWVEYGCESRRKPVCRRLGSCGCS